MSRCRQQGLTLLEVLAAFLIFSLVFTVLIGTSQSAVRSQGLSMRSLAANEMADLVLADIEIPMNRRELPVIEENEYAIDDFTVRIREESFADPAAAGAAGADPFAVMSGGLDAISLIQGQMPAVAPFLRRYDIEVEWIEANAPRTVGRTTFAFDWEAAQLANASLFAGSGDGSDAGEGNADGEDADGGSEGGADRQGRGRDGGQNNQGEAERILEIMREQGVEL